MEHSVGPQIFSEPESVDRRLRHHFGLSVADLADVANAIFRGFADVDSLHPKGFNGTNGWAKGTAAIRSILIPRGWLPADPQNQPRISSTDRRISITVSSGNSDTGVAERTPSTRNDKGSQTAVSVHHNAFQGLLFAVETMDDAPLNTGSASDGALWMVLYYIDLDAREVRMELSLPNNMSVDDKVNGWAIRYILPPMSFAPEFDGLSNDVTPDVDFDVIPKSL